MITDNKTNTVYFSNLLPEAYPESFNELSAIIESAGYKEKLLVETYDIYCRDYMPVQVAEDDFVQFMFRPKAYFKPEEYIGITNPVLVELMNRLPLPRDSPLILDGGNVVKATEKVIITDRVIKDNSYQFTGTEILAQLILNARSFSFRNTPMSSPVTPMVSYAFSFFKKIINDIDVIPTTI